MNSITTRVWIAGASGRLGSALSHRFGGNTAYKLVTSDRDVAVEDVSVVGRFADINHPDVIINCAGLTDVQACEENPEEAYKINAIGARNLATAARRIDAKFIQISTTYSAATRARLSVSSTIPIRPRCTARASTPVKSSCVS
mgnify:CR=1 FL=1